MNQDNDQSPRTVIRPRSGSAPSRSDPDLFPNLARPVLALAESIARDPAPNANKYLTFARDAIEAFEKEALRKGASPASIAPAVYGLLVILDTSARANKSMPLKAWSAGAMSALFRGRDTNLAGLRKLCEQAIAAGPAYGDLLVFLDQCVATAETRRAYRAPVQKSSTSSFVIAAFAAVFLAAVLWAAWVEWRYASALLAEMPDVDAMIAESPARDLTQMIAKLDKVATKAADVTARAAQSPLGLIHLLGFLDPASQADKSYRKLVNALLPETIADAIGISLASEGSGLALYDTLRSLAILTGKSDWNPYFLQGWLVANDHLVPGLAQLSLHVSHLEGPNPDLPLQDAELVDQALVFAAETPEATRAYLELVRSQATATLPAWQPEVAIPRINAVLVRRSEIPITTPIEGIFTAEGWTFAQTSGAALAVHATRRESALLFGKQLAQDRDASEHVLDVLQDTTIAQWQEMLGDIRVRPFSDQPSAVLISGTLGAKSSPLTAVLREAWLQTGGADTSRSFANQVKITEAFGAITKFLDDGKMKEVSHLFAALNVALSTLDADENVGVQRLMDVQARAKSISTLRQAPPLVVQIVEDVLAQTSISNEEVLKNKVNLLWQSQVVPQCVTALVSDYPFATGPDIDLTEFADLFGPGGSLTRFFKVQLSPLIDQSGDKWRWKPEARFSGFSPNSAEFFQRIDAVRQAYFGDAQSASANLTLTALAERGTASVTLGGASAPVVTSGTPAVLQWPGPQPESGIAIGFETGTGQLTQRESGPWGLLHIVEGLRLRQRDNGQRYLIDLRFGDARLFVEMAFDRPENPLSARELLRGLTCPASL